MSVVWSELRPAGDVNKDWVAAAVSADGQVILTGIYGGRLYLSTNGGASFAEAQPAGAADKDWGSCAVSADGATLLAAVRGGRLYLSTNGGGSWSEARPAGDANKNWNDVAVSYDGSMLIASISSTYVYASVDGGTSWAAVSPGGAGDYAYAACSYRTSLVVACSTGRLYRSTDQGATWTDLQPTGDADVMWGGCCISGGGATVVAWEPGARLWAGAVTFEAVIGAPVADSVSLEGEIAFSATHDADLDMWLQWEIDTTSPPDSGSDDYDVLLSAPTPARESSSVYRTLEAGTWTCRVRPHDGTSYHAWSDEVTLYVVPGVRMLPGTSVEVSILDSANRIYVVVDGSSPLTTGSATNHVTTPTHMLSPREDVVRVKGGDSTACGAIAAAHLALRKDPRYHLTGIRVPLRYGLGIARGNMVRIVIPSVDIDGEYAVRRLAHDFGRNVTTLDVGDYVASRDDQVALLRIAQRLAQLEKEIAI